MKQNGQKLPEISELTEAEREHARVLLRQLWQRGTEFLGVPYAILGGAMSWLSERHLVSAISNAGGFGVIACGAMDPLALAQEIAATQLLTYRPFGVNLIIMHPQLHELITVCLEAKVGHIVLAGGVPSAGVIQRIKEGGVKVIGFVPTLALAKRLVQMGVDALIIEGSEAGGHVGAVSLNVLAQEILPFMRDVPIFVAGGLARGDALVSYLERGASGGQFGTLFAAATESIAHDNFKKAFMRAAARDAEVSVQLDERFPVAPVRALKNAGSRRFLTHQAEVIQRFQSGELTRKEAQLAIEHFWAGALRRAAIEGDVENGSVMAGQSVGMVDSIQPVQQIITALVEQAIVQLAYQKRRYLSM